MPNLILPSRFTSQPQYPAQLDMSNPLLRGVEFVRLGSQIFYNPIPKSITNTGAITTGMAGQYGRGRQYSKTLYETYPLPVATGGTLPWTIATIIYTITAATYAGPINAFAGTCETPGSGVFDRQVGIYTGGAWSAYLYDGSARYATSSAIQTAGKTDLIVATTNGATLELAVKGYADASSAASNAGYNSYTSAEFCVGNSNTQTFGDCVIPLIIRTNSYWTRAMRQSFMNNPWQIFQAPARRLYMSQAGAAPTFNAGWAQRRSRVIGAGAY